ncbi:MAG TPA: hypothetical protein VGP46_09435, partial [Acidimicrobiales bacterium]|nr:hypothetical protein [Acidimicrobiales bacterium]
MTAGVFLAGLLVVLLGFIHAPAASAGGTCPADGSNDTWTGSGGTSAWATASNWSNGVPGTDTPTTNDHPCIPGTVTVAYSGGTTAIAALQAGDATLAVSGGELELGNTDTSSVGALEFTGGTIAGSGTIEVSGDSTWSAGTLGDPSLGGSPVPTLDMTSGTLSVGGVVEIDGSALDLASGVTTTVTSGNRIIDENGATISNAGTFELDGSTYGTVTAVTNPIDNGGTFTNTGTVETTGTVANSTVPFKIWVPYLSTAGSTVVNSGTLFLNDGSGGSADAAPFIVGNATAGRVAAGLVLNGTQDLGPGSTITDLYDGSTPNSVLAFDSGSITIDASMDVPRVTVSGATVTLDVAAPSVPLALASGEIVFEENSTLGKLTWTGGTIAGPATVTVSGESGLQSGSTTLGDPSLPGSPVTTFDCSGFYEIAGTLTVDHADLDGCDLVGLATNLVDGATLRLAYASSTTVNVAAGCTVSNSGSSQISDSSFDGAGMFLNTGTLNAFVGEGDDYINTPYVSTGGETDISNGGTLYITGGSGGETDTGPFVMEYGGSLSLSGNQSLGAGAEISVLNDASASTLSLPSGDITFGGRVRVSAGVTSAADVTATTSFGAAGTPLTLTGGEFVFDVSSTLPNLDWTGGTIAGPGTVHIEPGPLGTNSSWSGGTLGDSSAGSHGALDVQSGSLAVGSTVSIVDKDVLQISPNASVEVASGSVLDVGAGGSVSDQGTLDFTGNASVDNLGSAGDLTNSGTVETTGGSGTTTIGMPYVSTGGSTEADAGTLVIPTGGRGTTDTGPFTIGNGDSLVIAGTQSFSSGATITGTGTGSLYLAGAGPMTIGSVIDVPGGARIHASVTLDAAMTDTPVRSGGVPGTAGTVTFETATVLPSLTWNAGTIAGPATVEVTGEASLSGGTLSAGTLELDGTSATVGELDVSSGATLEMDSAAATVSGLSGTGTLALEGGTMTVRGSDAIGTFTQSGGTYQVNISGTTPGTGFGQLVTSVGYSLSG